MKTVQDFERDAERLVRWIEEHAEEFAPLDIVSVSAKPDGNADDKLIIFVTVELKASAENDSWTSEDTFKLYRAVQKWGYDAGYLIPPHVHLQAARAA